MGVLPVFVMVMPAGTKNVPMVDIVLTVALSNVMTSPGASVGLARMPWSDVKSSVALGLLTTNVAKSLRSSRACTRGRQTWR